MYDDQVIPSIQNGLDYLKKEVNRKDDEYSVYQKLYPYIKKLVERYGDTMYGLNWHGTPVFYFKKYNTVPKGFLSYAEKIGLTIKNAGQSSMGYCEVEFTNEVSKGYDPETS